MLDREWNVKIIPPTSDDEQYSICTQLLGGHTDVQYAPDAEQAQALKLQIIERLKLAADHMRLPVGGCDAG